MTFRGFLKQKQAENHYFGDIYYDLKETKCRASSYKGIKADLDKHGACDEAYWCLEDAFAEYSKIISK